nr:putative capsid [Marmot picobirnavirus]
MNKSSKKRAKRKPGSNRSDNRENHHIRSSDDGIADKRNGVDCRTKGDNDPAWYAQSPQLIKDYASLPFGNPLGSQLPNIGNLNVTAIPGVCVLYYAPTIGVANDPNAAVNVAMRNIYSYVRHENSGSTNYDAPDLMLYLLAMDSVFMFHAYLKRVLGTLMLYTSYNRYYPQTVIEAMGVKFSDIQAHISDFRGYINQYAVKIGSMRIPNSMSYMARHTWMAEHLYVDDPSTPKAQTYMYCPSTYFKFELDSHGAGKLNIVNFLINSVTGKLETLKTFEDLRNFGDSLINPLLANEDFNVMSGDILKAFGPDGIVTVTGVSENYIVLPEYSPEVLSQMENASIMSTVGLGVTQTTEVGTGYLVSNPTCVVNAHCTEIPQDFPSLAMSSAAAQQLALPYIGNRIFNMHHQDVTPEEVVVASRLMVCVKREGVSGDYLPPNITRVLMDVASCGSEIIESAKIFTFNYRGEVLTTEETPLATSMYSVIGYESDVDRLVRWMVNQHDANYEIVSQFNWHPLIYPASLVVQRSSQELAIPPAGLFGDVSNYTTISENNIINMNDLALLSEFTVPITGLYRN